MYSNDSFFDLSVAGQIGLFVISTILFVMVFFLTRRASKGLKIWQHIVFALFVFWLFVWLSPQVYYMYYRVLIPGLPLQWVIWPPASPLVALEYLLFQGPANLSAHSQGLLGWSLVLSGFVRLSWFKAG